MGARTEVVKDVVLAPFKIAEVSLRLGRSATVYVARSVVGMPSRKGHIAVELQQHHPLDKALAAVADIHEGQKGDAPDSAELVQIGKATIVKALIDAEKDDIVPDEITTAVAHVVAEEVANPHAVELVPDELANAADAILQARLGD